MCIGVMVKVQAAKADCGAPGAVSQGQILQKIEDLEQSRDKLAVMTVK